MPTHAHARGQVHNVFGFVYSILVRMGLIEEQQEEEWDEEDYLAELPQGLADDIRQQVWGRRTCGLFRLGLGFVLSMCIQ